MYRWCDDTILMYPIYVTLIIYNYDVGDCMLHMQSYIISSMQGE